MRKKRAKSIDKIDFKNGDILDGMGLSDTEVRWVSRMVQNASNGIFLCHSVGKNGCEICYKIFPELKRKMNELKVGKLCPCDMYTFDRILPKSTKKLDDIIKKAKEDGSRLLR